MGRSDFTQRGTGPTFRAVENRLSAAGAWRCKSNPSRDIILLSQPEERRLCSLQRKRNLLVPRPCSLCVTFTQRPNITGMPWGFHFGKFGANLRLSRSSNATVMIKQIDDHDNIVPRRTISAGLWDMYFWVDDIDALFKEFVERRAKIDYGLCYQPYDFREFGTQDIDGHDIGFGQIVS
jgi:hypothetical protein